MKQAFKLSILIFLILASSAISKEDFFTKAKILFEKEKFEESKFLFQRSIVFNPKDSKSYLYLAKIYKVEENEKEEEKNLNVTLLLEPDNEEAMFMLIDIGLKRSNFSKVKKLAKDFELICSSLCEKISLINERLENIEAKNNS